ncbi:MAG: hypothetical protein IPM82_11770 [Saprospiraceae bacterium]|nr:hypothetical protein [Saprospiraceae bacterium]
MVVNDSLPEERFGTCKKLIRRWFKRSKQNSFQLQIRPPEIRFHPIPTGQHFRVFTWQLYVDVDDYKYYGAIQMNTSKLQLFPLIDRSAAILNRKSTTC